MPIANQGVWDEFVKNNTDSYGGACIAVARKAMEILDEEPGLEPGDFNAHSLICRANKESGVGGITGFMAGCVAMMITRCHSRGEEFRKNWNIDVQAAGPILPSDYQP